jgi:hypothetical protein
MTRKILKAYTEDVQHTYMELEKKKKRETEGKGLSSGSLSKKNYSQLLKVEEEDDQYIGKISKKKTKRKTFMEKHSARSLPMRG